VRYISHELRTPLNAASAGLQVLEAELRCSAYPEDDDRLDTLRDVSLSVTTTVDILNVQCWQTDYHIGYIFLIKLKLASSLLSYNIQ
jgi:signal transduction histidine kinase